MPHKSHNLFSQVPWAVTANLAVRNTAERFDLRFPKTGGGEDIDWCIRSCDAKLVVVPKVNALYKLKHSRFGAMLF